MASDCEWAWMHPENCRAAVFVKDTYRRTGRGRSRFEMHYIRKQCGRKAGESGYCWQHAPSTATAPNPPEKDQLNPTPKTP